MSLFGLCYMYCFFCFKQKTAYEMRISDWSSDVCSSDLSAADSMRDLGGTPAQCALAPPPGQTSQQQQGQTAADPGVGRVIALPIGQLGEIGRASCRERVCQYV